MMVMTGVAALAAATALPRATADPEQPAQPVAPGPDAAPANIIFADDFDGPAGAAPDLSKWTVVSWNEPVNPPVLGMYRDDRRNVSLDGNGNLALRATKEGDTFFTGRVDSKFKIGINHTWEARIQLPQAPGLWPAYWLVNIEDTTDGRGPLPTARSTSSSGTATTSGRQEPLCTPGPTARRGTRTAGPSMGIGTPTDANGMRRASNSGWTTSPDRRTSRFRLDPSRGMALQ